MSLSQITALLRETLGLDVASVGVSLIERAVKRRVNAHGLRDVSQYADLLQRSPPELQNLFEAVVIPETFFFRYPEFRKQYFHKTEAGFQLCDRVRQCVNFDPKELKGAPVTVAKARATYFKGLLLWQNKSVGCLNDQLLFEMLDES